MAPARATCTRRLVTQPHTLAQPGQRKSTSRSTQVHARQSASCAPTQQLQNAYVYNRAVPCRDARADTHPHPADTCHLRCPRRMATLQLKEATACNENPCPLGLVCGCRYPAHPALLPWERPPLRWADTSAVSALQLPTLPPRPCNPSGLWCAPPVVCQAHAVPRAARWCRTPVSYTRYTSISVAMPYLSYAVSASSVSVL